MFIADGQIPPYPPRSDLPGLPFIDPAGFNKTVFGRGVLLLLPVQASQPVQKKGPVAFLFPDADFFQKPVRECQGLPGCPDRVRYFSGFALYIRQLQQGFEIQGSETLMGVRIMVLCICPEILGCQSLLPLHGLLQIVWHPVSMQVHIRQLLRRFHTRVLRFGGGTDQFQGFFIVCFHIDAVQIGQADKEAVLRRTVILFFGDPVQCPQKNAVQLRPAVLIPQAADLPVPELTMPPQLFCVDPPVFSFFPVFRLIHLDRNDREFTVFLYPVPRHGIFHPHYIIAVLFQMRCDGHGEQGALLKGVRDGFVEALTGDQKFVKPDGDILICLIFVNQPHQAAGVTAVLLAVAEEYIGVKGVPDLLGQFVPDQNRVQEGGQDLFIGSRGGIRGIFGDDLDLGADVTEFIAQPVFQHDGQDGHMLFESQGKLYIPGPVFLIQKTGGDSEDHQLHFVQDFFQFPPVRRGGRICVIPDRAVDMAEYVFGDQGKCQIKVIRMAGKVYTGFSLRTAHTVCDIPKFHRRLLSGHLRVSPDDRSGVRRTF